MANVSPLGRRKDAQAAALGQLKSIAEGAYRKVYSDKDGRFVYKVAKYEPEQNIVEHERSRKAREDNVPGIAPTYLWHVKNHEGRTVPVICMRRYQDPAKQDASDLVLEKGLLTLWKKAGFVDLHSYNYTLTKNGQPRLIDMGGYA